jgi:hypothetical protein
MLFPSHFPPFYQVRQGCTLVLELQISFFFFFFFSLFVFLLFLLLPSSEFLDVDPIQSVQPFPGMLKLAFFDHAFFQRHTLLTTPPSSHAETN